MELISLYEQIIALRAATNLLKSTYADDESADRLQSHIEDMERQLYSHMPTTAEEAAAMMEHLKDELSETDNFMRGWTTNKTILALSNVLAFLRSGSV